MEQKPATIENNLGNARLLGALGDRFADRRRRIDRCTGLVAHILVEARRHRERLARRIVDDLRIDMATRTMDRQTRAQRALDPQFRANALTPLFEK